MTTTTWPRLQRSSSAARASWLSRPIAPEIIALALAVVGLNLIDGFATLRHLDAGAVEVNPLMRGLLARGPVTFLAGKHLLASVGVVGMVAHSQHRAARVMLGWVLFPVYVAIAAYQLALFMFI